ncbi:MAG TPA: acetyl-CoA carboxylase biotin carboxyl carrier protein [Gammaproteobacteria bacterium]|nr:acetyl-CoA carboxylase biotin carboxyl carrier protein [Gammaproteobacteria bacterium]
MDIRKVKKLIELLEESDVVELEIKEGEESVRISRGKAAAMPMPMAPMMAAPMPAAAQAPAAATAPEGASREPSYDGHVVESPMVGTYYEAPAPGNPPFVKVGQRVNVGDTLCIIEAMKILNQIESDVAGEVKAVLCKNGDPVEYGQKLFVIK